MGDGGQGEAVDVATEPGPWPPRWSRHPVFCVDGFKAHENRLRS